MKNFKLATVVGIFSVLMALASTQLKADSAEGFGIGINGISGDFETNGSEVMKGSTSAGNATKVTQSLEAASIFAEYTFEGGSAVGIAVIPGTHGLGSKTTTRTDKLTDGTGTTVTQVAAAEATDHVLIYVDATIMGPIYITAGLAEVGIDTTESLGTGSSYGNTDVWGYMVGIGAKGDLGDTGVYGKIAATYTDYEQINLSSTGSDVASTISADIDVVAAQVSIGYKF